MTNCCLVAVEGEHSTELSQQPSSEVHSSILVPVFYVDVMSLVSAFTPFPYTLVNLHKPDTTYRLQSATTPRQNPPVCKSIRSGATRWRLSAARLPPQRDDPSPGCHGRRRKRPGAQSAGFGATRWRAQLSG